jgi:hypothetical protein
MFRPNSLPRAKSPLVVAYGGLPRLSAYGSANVSTSGRASRANLDCHSIAGGFTSTSPALTNTIPFASSAPAVSRPRNERESRLRPQAWLREEKQLGV